VVLVDCLTLWLSNLVLSEHDVPAATDRLLAALADVTGTVLLVSNEVGMGIVPENALARRFRDEAGRLNQRIAAVANEVLFVAAGLAVRMK
jgi:adenosylcobinamide kinase/adenosylcobinamide-phosphate guanylyltransferase